MTFRSANEDPVRQFTEREEGVLTRNLLGLTQELNALDYFETDYSIDLIIDWHKRLFEGVRDHAGKVRTADYGEERLDFGPNKSIARERVPEELDRHIDLSKGLFRQLDKLTHTISFVEEAIKAAAYIHADLVKIHPFRDGNGRTARLAMKYVLLKYNLPPLPINVPSLEYIDSLNHFYQTRSIDPLVELLIRIYYNQFLA
jgi:Fic family protein